MIIQHNIAALNSHRQLGINNSNTNKNLEKLSSGYRINRAGDDAAGLAISEKMRGQIRGLSQAEMNTSHAINLIQTAEGGLQETHAILQRMRELAVQSSNGTYDNDVDRANLEKEYTALMEEVNRISTSTHYNGIQLLDGSSGEVNGGSLDGLDALTALAVDDFDMTGATAFDGQDAQLIFRGDGTLVLRIGDQYFEEGATQGQIEDGAGNVIFEVTYTPGNVWGSINFTIDVTTAGSNGNAGEWEFDPSAPTGDEDLIKVAAFGVNEVTFQIGANGTADQRVGTYVQNMSSYSLGDVAGGVYIVDTTISIPRNDGTNDGANEAIDVIDKAINQVSGVRADLGALQNRLEHTMNNLGVTKENLTAAESTIRDVDMAKEMMEYTKNTILVQASQAMLAQAQTLPQGVLNLLR